MHPVQSLRICVASSGLGHVLRGIESWAFELGMALAQRGARVFLCKGAAPARADFERVIPCWTRDSKAARRVLQWIPNPLGWRIGLGAGYDVEQTSFALNLIRFLRRERIDILHLQDPRVAIMIQRAARAGIVRTRTILNHGTEEPLEFLKKIDFVQHGAPWHQQTAKAAGAWKESWTMIPNFVDTGKYFPGNCPQLRQQFDIPPSALVALVSSAIKKQHKRIDYIVNEFAHVRQQFPDKDWWLVVAGSRSGETDELITLAHRCLGAHVRFAIDFPADRMPELYRMADFLIHASLMEMMPMALLEATASGLPCLHHQHPVMEWIVASGGQALDMQKPGALAEAIIGLNLDQRRRAELSAAARWRCTAQFDRTLVLDQIMKHYSYVHYYPREQLAKAV